MIPVIRWTLIIRNLQSDTSISDGLLKEKMNNEHRWKRKIIFGDLLFCWGKIKWGRKRIEYIFFLRKYIKETDLKFVATDSRVDFCKVCIFFPENNAASYIVCKFTHQSPQSTQNFWVYSEFLSFLFYIAEFWQTFWVI